MKIFNTMSQQVEDLIVQDGKVGIYVCGVTPYDTAHLGHAFVYSTFDILVRLLRAAAITVTYVENVTDIDDPLFAKATELGNITWDELARRETERFIREMDAIHVVMPDHLVRASDELPQMIGLIEQLLANGHAYLRDGWIYFSIASDPSFATLAAATGIRGHDALLAVANERGNDPTDPRKQDPLDFLLWRGAAPDEPAWPSPWGPGRPGWHIECSAMSMHYLGPQVDIHGGGSDLIFPHHSCEIAQAENVTGVRPFVRYWMHVGMVGLGGTKMSKSLGNLIIVGDLLQHYTPTAIRLLLANHHYRSEWEYTTAAMDAAQLRADRLTRAASGPDDVQHAPVDAAVTTTLATQARAALSNDLDTPTALAALDQLAAMILEARLPDAEVAAARHQLRDLARLLGLRLQPGG